MGKSWKFYDHETSLTISIMIEEDSAFFPSFIELSLFASWLCKVLVYLKGI